MRGIDILSAQWSLYVPHSGHYMYRTVVTVCIASLTLTNSTFIPHSVFVCFEWISEQTAIISLYSIKWLVCITERECVYCAVRTGCVCLLMCMSVYVNAKLRTDWLGSYEQKLLVRNLALVPMALFSTHQYQDQYQHNRRPLTTNNSLSSHTFQWFLPTLRRAFLYLWQLLTGRWMVVRSSGWLFVCRWMVVMSSGWVCVCVGGGDWWWVVCVCVCVCVRKTGGE